MVLEQFGAVTNKERTKIRWPAWVMFAIVIVSGACSAGAKEGESKMAFVLKSSAFENGGFIPAKYACDGDDVSPPLEWSGTPQGTQSFTLISDDPDAPVGTWVHWVVYDLPAELESLPENLPKAETLPNGAKQGLTDFRRVGYGGPCPPSGVHRYFFKLYALDTKLELPPRKTKKDLLGAMKGHILGQAEWMGKYTRQR